MDGKGPSQENGGHGRHAVRATLMTPKSETVEIFEIPISRISFSGVCQAIHDRIERRDPGYIVTPNVDHVCTYHRNDDFRQAYTGAFLVLPDGTPIIWASWLFGRPLPQKLSGSDLVPALCGVAAEYGHSVFFFGGTRGAAERTVDKLKANYPGLRVAGIYWPPYGFEKDPDENQRAIDAVRVAQPDICFLALGSPKQEIWMARHYQDLGAIISIGVGGAFELVSGKVRRAPNWVQEIGFEWLWRLAHEPRRLWHRYLVDDLVFFKLLWEEYRRRRAAPSTHISG
ncbi:MAG: WecB/TagA/CpsF family glycosyltransferase [Candidatus Hydrogenedentes bacterium]|nr:WecB/TagA/CpsF family glycosyltransferase [Candidatus Hydrogenedentota bacterium]